MLVDAVRHPLSLSGRLTLAAAFLAVLVAVVPPAGYAVVFHHYLRSALSAEADLVAGLAGFRLAIAPGAGKANASGLESFVKGDFHRDELGLGALRRQLLSATGEVLFESGPAIDQSSFRLREERLVRDAGRVVGRFTIESSLGTLVDRTLKVALSSVLVATLLFLGLHQLPLRALRIAERDLSFLATHDRLTGLPNRALFGDRLEQSLHRAVRNRTKVGLYFMDLDHFKSVNDTLGHPAGDAILRQVVVRLLNRIRSCDTLARISGDEFMVVAEGGQCPEDFLELARQLRAGFEEPFVVGDKSVSISVSGGVAVFPDDAKDSTTLVRNADLAMYDAKQKGRDGFRFFTASLSEEMERRSALHLRLRRALENDEFRLHYQPIHCAACSLACGYEALLRWEQAPGVFAAPGEFIASLEETGLIVPVGQWVIEEACRKLSALAREGRDDMTVSVNVSVRQIHDGGLAKLLRDTLESIGVNPARLVVEITESILLGEEASTESQLREISALGVGIALDDFGTGYSSFSYLRRFPLNCIKIDKSFVAPLALAESQPGIRIVEAIIGLAHGLGLHVTAEGIETQEQADILRGLDCDRLQGYYFGGPLKAPGVDDVCCSSARFAIAAASESNSTA